MMKWFYKLLVVFTVLTLLLLAGCSNKEKAMVNAVKNNDITKVESLLDQGVSPNLKTEDGKTILMLATYLGHADIAKLLIEKGAEVNAKDNDGKTALMYAAEPGHVDMARLLLNNGAELKATDNNGETALQIAQDNHQTEMVEFLSNWGKTTTSPGTNQNPVSITPEPTPVPTNTNESKTASETAIVQTVKENKQLGSVFFDFNRAVLRPDQIDFIQSNLVVLKENPQMFIILGGHADEVGSRKYNQTLSEKRARAVRNYLTTNGIAAERIIIYGFGKDHPLRNGHDEAARSYNRRVDILNWDAALTREQVIETTIQ
jgi:outer membrane protein OmpA-like peptidoglycan-associated protein